MRKILLTVIISLSFLFFSLLIYMSTSGIETNRFNALLENKITSNLTKVSVNLKKLKIKLNIKNLGFFVTTKDPKIEFNNNQINIKKIDAYINFISLFSGTPLIENIYISSNESDINDLKNTVRYFKPSNFKKFFLNEIKEGKLNYNLDLNLVNNQIDTYEISGYIKDLFVEIENVNISKASFIFSIREKQGEFNNIRGNIGGLQVNSGNIKFNTSKKIKVIGELNSDVEFSKNEIFKFFKKYEISYFEKLNVVGKIKKKFEIVLDSTLKLIDYKLSATGNIKKSEIKLSNAFKLNLLKNEVNDLKLQKTEFKIDYDKKKFKNLYLKGQYSVNSKSPQKFEFSNIYSDKQKIIFNGDFNSEINIPLLNYSTNDRNINIKAELDIKKNSINLNNITLKDGKSKIDVNNMSIKNKQLVRFNNIKIKTYKEYNELNNDFTIDFTNKLKISGSKYDAKNLTKFFDNDSSSKFLNNISKEIAVNLDEINTDVSNKITNFNLIGSIQKGRFNKIVSKGEFYENKYLEISLREDEVSKMKILEIYSDLPKTLLSNYKFFDGISGGSLLLNSYYNTKISNTQLIIENFKVKNAPNFVKLLSLADFGGMADAISGEGLSFEKLEMKIEKDNKLLNLRELYAIGPSISILMEGYVESKSDLVSLRGTMVPAKTLNKFLSKVPIVGDILIPKEIGEGLFGISFKMKGTQGNIKTTVNPIKSLTPRFIQRAIKKAK